MSRRIEKKSMLSLVRKRNDEFNPNKPVMVGQLREYQHDVLRELEESRYVAVCFSRRGGKDIMSLYEALRLCATEPNQKVYYVLPTIAQAKEIIAGYNDEGENMITSLVCSDLIQYTTSGRIVSYDNKITFKNGSYIRLFGADQDKMLGTSINLLVISEAATFPVQNILNKMQPSIAKVKGKIIMVSTPRLGSNFNEIMLDPDSLFTKAILTATDPRLLKIDGTPVYTEEDLEDSRKIMSKENFEQEYMCSMTQHNEASIYGGSFDNHTRANNITLKANEKIFISFDLGIRDLTSMVFSVVRNDKVVVFDHYAAKNQATQHFIDTIKSKGFKPSQCILVMPHDISKRMDVGTALISREQYYRQARFDVRVLSPQRVVRTIELTRTCIQKQDLVFGNNNNVQKMIQKIKMYEWKVDRGTGEILAEPRHGSQGYSDIADSLEYLCLFFFFDKYNTKKINANKGNASWKY